MVSGEEILHCKKNYNCGIRNSYSKTDQDATFMLMKEDVYIRKNQKQLKVTGTRKSKSKTGYVTEKTLYSC